MCMVVCLFLRIYHSTCFLCIMRESNSVLNCYFYRIGSLWCGNSKTCLYQIQINICMIIKKLRHQCFS
jgi:hypothetical protein